MKLNGKMLNIIRATQGKSIRQVASESGCSTATVQKAIHCENIRDLSAGKIANALGVNLAVLAADPEEQTQARGD